MTDDSHKTMNSNGEPKALSSEKLAALAGRAITKPESLSHEEIRQLAASVLSQRKPVQN